MLRINLRKNVVKYLYIYALNCKRKDLLKVKSFKINLLLVKIFKLSFLNFYFSEMKQTF